MKRHQSATTILRDMLPLLPERFTIDEVLDNWPQDEMRLRNSVREGAKKLVVEGLVMKDGALHYRQTKPKPVFHRTEMHKKWDAFRESEGI